LNTNITNINIWDIKLNPLSKKEIIELIEKHIVGSCKLFNLTGVNVETIVQVQENPELRMAVNDSNLVNIDNMLVVTSLRLLGYRIPERTACPDIFEQLLALSNQKGYSVYFLGASEDVMSKMLRILKVKYPDLKITGSRNGYYEARDEPLIVKEIYKKNPDMLFVALPTPQKELFIYRNKADLGTRFAFGVGGAFDVLAGKVVRAPVWMRNIGLEGIHRALQNPADYGARYKKYYIPFMKLVVRKMFRKH